MPEKSELYYMEELNYHTSMRHRTHEARQRIAYMQAEMEDTKNEKLRNGDNAAGGQHCL